MPTLGEIKIALDIPRNTKPRQAINRAIRLCCPGGALLLQYLETADYRRVHDPGNPHLIAEVDTLRARRDALEADLLSGRQSLTPIPVGELKV